MTSRNSVTYYFPSLALMIEYANPKTPATMSPV